MPTPIKLIVTGATGMVGEGVLLESLANPAISDVLLVTRKPYDLTHPKLKQLQVPDFLQLQPTSELSGYDACFFCAGVSSVGKSEADYTRITYDTTLHFAEVLAQLNPRMTFVYVSGAHTDSTEQGKSMWARVKGRTENALTRVGFAHVYNFRPGFMKPIPGQKSLKPLVRYTGALYPILHLVIPNLVSTLKEVAQAMIRVATTGYPQTILEVKDINSLAKP